MAFHVMGMPPRVGCRDPSEDGRLPYFATRQINRRGVVVVRGVVPADTALRWRDSLLVRATGVPLHTLAESVSRKAT